MKIIIFDTETTGLPQKDASLAVQPYLTQFAAITYDFNPQTRHLVEHSRFDSLIKPPIAIPAESSRITGITDQLVQNCPTFAQIAEEIRNLFAFSDAAIAHNLEFDRLVISYELERAGFSTDFLPPEIYDSMENTRDLCKLSGRSGGYKAPKLMELHQFLLGQSFEEAHNALKDVEALARCVKVLLTQGYYVPQFKSRQKSNNIGSVQESLF